MIFNSVSPRVFNLIDKGDSRAIFSQETFRRFIFLQEEKTQSIMYAIDLSLWQDFLTACCYMKTIT